MPSPLLIASEDIRMGDAVWVDGTGKVRKVRIGEEEEPNGRTYLRPKRDDLDDEG